MEHEGPELCPAGGPPAAAGPAPSEGGILMDTRPIGVFDSGLGGLTAVPSCAACCPARTSFILVIPAACPTAPAGGRSSASMPGRTSAFFFPRCKFIIAACGTVSSTYPPGGSRPSAGAFTGVVGATARAAVDATRNGKGGHHRHGGHGAQRFLRGGHQGHEAGDGDRRPRCPMFVPLVENGYVNDGNPVTKLIIAEYLQEVRMPGRHPDPGLHPLSAVEKR